MILLEAGADPNQADAQGLTPADFASASDSVWGHFAGTCRGPAAHPGTATPLPPVLPLSAPLTPACLSASLQLSPLSCPAPAPHSRGLQAPVQGRAGRAGHSQATGAGKDGAQPGVEAAKRVPQGQTGACWYALSRRHARFLAAMLAAARLRSRRFIPPPCRPHGRRHSRRRTTGGRATGTRRHDWLQRLDKHPRLSAVVTCRQPPRPVDGEGARITESGNK